MTRPTTAAQWASPWDRCLRVLRGRGLRARLPGLARIWDSYVAGGDIVCVQVDGLVQYLHRQDEGIAGAILGGEPYEHEERSFVERFLRPGMVVVDIGAHAGLYSCLAARQVGAEGHVIAFEPDPVNHQLLQRSIAANRFDCIRAERVAIGDRAGEARLVRHSINHGAHYLSSDATGAAGPGAATSAGSRVSVLTLDEYLEARPLPRIDLVKLDIEGTELQAVRGMARTIETHGARMALLSEFFPALLERAGTDPAAYLAHLRAHGFRLWSPNGAEWNDAEIVAIAKERGYLNLVAARNAPPPAEAHTPPRGGPTALLSASRRRRNSQRFPSSSASRARKNSPDGCSLPSAERIL